MLTGASTPHQLAISPGEGRRRHRRAHGHLQGADRHGRRRQGGRPEPACSTTLSSPSTRTASTRSSRRCAPARGSELERRSGLTARRHGGRRHRLCARRKAVIGIYGMGLTQHRTGVENVQMLVNLLLLRGNIGKPGAGICPVRGHSNVQGQRTVGITEKPELVPLDKLKELYGFEPPREKGLNTRRGLRGDARRRGARPSSASAAISSAPCRSATAMEPAWRRLRLTVQIVDQAQPQPRWCTARSPSSCPASAASRSTSRRPARRPCRMEDSTGLHPRLARPCQAGEPASAVGAQDRRRDRQGDAAAQPAASTGTPGSPTTRGSATPSRRPIRTSSRTSTSACGSRAASTARFRRAERKWKTETGKANFIVPRSLSTRISTCRPSAATCCS